MKSAEVRIGVYTICKNENQFVRRFVESIWCNGRGANRLFILDTGSTDNTVETFLSIISELNIPIDWLVISTKTYECGFRFDVARNDNLEMIDPDEFDVLMSVDLDEILVEDFWPDLRNIVSEHPDFSRIHYLYAWNHDENNNPGRVFWYDKIHPSRGYRWKCPVHEMLYNIDSKQYVYGDTYKMNENIIYLHHYPDSSKPRSSLYLPLLEIRVKENPYDMYGMYYLMREYMFANNLDGAFRIANIGYAYYSINSNNDTWNGFTHFSLALANLYRLRGYAQIAEYYYKIALGSEPTLRCCYIDYAQFLAYKNKSNEVLTLLENAEKLAPKKNEWHELDFNWTWRPLLIKAIAYCWQKKYGDALELFMKIESEYLKTDKDIREASVHGFYDDYFWLINFLESHGFKLRS